MSALAQLAVPVQIARDHIRGSAAAPVTLLEYGDFECPQCGAAHAIIEAVRRRIGPDLCFVFRHFPLTNVHPRAGPSAEAAEAAGVQGRFWEMHDVLFDHQDALEDDDLLTYAAMLHLEIARFARELAERVHAMRVRQDFMGGVRSGVNGTPTLYINRLRYEGRRDVEFLVVAIEEARDAALRGQIVR